MAAILSFSNMVEQALAEIRHPNDAAMTKRMKAWLNEETLGLAEQYDFPELFTRWHTTVTSSAQYDDALPKMIRSVPRDIIRIVQAHWLDKNVSPYQWYPVNIIPMKEFDRRFFRTAFTDMPGRPKYMALREAKEHIFAPSAAAVAVGYSEDCEGLAAGNVDTQGGWSVTSPAYRQLDVDTGSEMSGANSLLFSGAADAGGYSYKQDIPVAQAYALNVDLKGVTSGSPIYLFVTDGADPLVASWRLSPDVVWGLSALRTPAGWTIAFVSRGVSMGAMAHGGSDTVELAMTVSWTGLVTIIADGSTTATFQLTYPWNTSRLHFAAATAASVRGIDNIVYLEETPPSNMPVGIRVKSSTTEAAGTKLVVNYYPDAERLVIAKAETASQITGTAQTLYSQIVYGILGISKNDYSLGVITVEDTYGQRILQLMAHEINAVFPQVCFEKWPEEALELYIIYKRRPPIMTKDSDTTYMLPTAAQPVIVQGAVARGLKYIEDSDWQAAEVKARELRGRFVKSYLPDLIEEAHAYIAEEHGIGLDNSLFPG